MFGRTATRSCRSTRPGNLALEGLHPLGKRVAQPFDDLEQRQIDIGQPAAGDIAAAIVLQQPLEIAEIFRHAFLPEFLAAFFRRRAF
jgi:hypothetical protein